MIAPASLKLARRHVAARPLALPTPGHDCPGLIEAGGVVSGAGESLLTTPGHDCPGLIEAPPPGANTWRSRIPLRGMIAPASLKRQPGLSPVPEAQPTPGHDCPGLIEASSRPRPPCGTSQAHSGA